MNYGYIYKTTNLINGRIYIGQHTGSFTHNYLGSGKLIIRALRKYGKDNFRLEIIAYASTREMLHSLEIEHIEKYRNLCGVGFLYNITKGGTGNPRTEETKEKISLSNKGRKLSEEHKKKLSEIHKGRKHKPHSKETKEKLRQSHFRHKSDCKCGVCKRQRGEAIEHKIECKCSHCKSIRGEIKWSDDTNKKRSQSLIGHKFNGKRLHSKESIDKMIKAKLKYWKETRENGSYIAIP